MTTFRCELLSADQLAALAVGPLSEGLSAGEAKRSLHRDVYLDTPDDTLRRRGIVCRLRTKVAGGGSLSLMVPAQFGGPARVDVPTAGGDARQMLASENAVVRRLRGVVDPAAMTARIDVEIDRLTRMACLDWLRRPRLEVHLDRVTVRRNGSGAFASFFQLCAHQTRGTGAELQALERALEATHGIRASELGVRERAELAIKWVRLDDASRSHGSSDHVHRAARVGEPASTPEFLNAELSQLSFHRRVLALAENPETPLRERIRFLSIVGANIDEFFMVRMAAFAAAASEATEEAADDWLSAAEQLAAIHDAIRAITNRQAVCLTRCFAELAEHELHVKRWTELSPRERDALTERFRDEIQPLLTPLAMTLSPGHPLPRLSHLSLAMATIVRNRGGGPPRFAELELPSSLPRFFEVAGTNEPTWVALEEVVRANLDALYPDAVLEQAFVFRVTRSAELTLDEVGADDLLEEVARAAAGRGFGVAVRLEVERQMPGILRALLLENLRRESVGDTIPFVTDVEPVDGLLDMSALSQLALPDDPRFAYRRRVATSPFGEAPSMFAEIARRNVGAGGVLVHHPFESFGATVCRFVREASADESVLAIKMTLYRVGDPSPVADALLDAARAGKAVTVFVELKARFDESVNVGWARALERAGGHVVRGLVGFKNHAKLALVVRREGPALKRYVHIGTGNYNARSGEQYTDLSLFTADEAIAADVADLFNELTGSSEPPRQPRRALLVAPNSMLPAILELIAREGANARAGRPAAITAKFNGLSDPDVIRALYRASQNGVEITLVVRGICRLVPGVAGRSERIRVVSVVGRFLEHSRIYRFGLGPDATYLIGSADLRPRNLRRRVEVLVPIVDPLHRRRLDTLLAAYANDPTGWDLGADGEYTQRGGAAGAGAHVMLASAHG